MNKAVMLSIRPKWVEKIANGEKTIEVRKTKPKLETPFKCYIYCTNIRPFLVWGDVFRGDWFTEFTRISGYSRAEADKIWDVFNGHIAGEFTCDRIYKIDKDSTDFLFKFGRLSVYKQAAEEKCGLCMAMTDDELHGYLGHCQGYGWHISGLRIYDEPRELGVFRKPEFPTGLRLEDDEIKHPPQSWYYVEAMKDE